MVIQNLLIKWMGNRKAEPACGAGFGFVRRWLDAGLSNNGPIIVGAVAPRGASKV
jgi:hypothetical protein